MQETWVRSLGREDPLEKEMATRSSILAWRIPWTEEPGGLQSTGSQSVGHDWATLLLLYYGLIYWHIWGAIILFTSSTIDKIFGLVKNLHAMRETQVWSLGQEDPLEKGMATRSSILAWRIPWPEEPGRLQSMGSQRVGHDWATEQQHCSFRCKALQCHYCIDKMLVGGLELEENSIYI